MFEMQVANDTIEAPFFEGLDTENKLDENFVFKNLLKVKENDILIDSPFKQIGQRNKETIISFIKLLDILIDINDFSFEATLANDMIYSKVLTWGKDLAIILKIIFNYCKNRDLPSLLNVIDAVWANIKIDYKLIDTKYKNTNESNSGGLDKPVLSQNDESKYFNLQIVLLFWWSKLEKYFKENSDIPSMYQNKYLKKFISNLNKYLPKTQNISLDEIKLDKVVAELFCTDFFRFISKVLLYNMVPETRAISNPEAVIGVVIGLILDNNKIIRTNLAK